MRKIFHLSQSGLAGVFASSTSRIQSYEQGRRRPDGLTSRVIRFLEAHEELIEEFEKT